MPPYRFHKARNGAVLRIHGKDHYLGPWQSPGSNAKYDRLIPEYLANGRTLDLADQASTVSVAEARKTGRVSRRRWG